MADPAPELHRRFASAAPASWDDAARTVEAVIATAHPVQRRDAKGPYLEVLDPATLARKTVAGAPLLDNHRTGSSRDLVGIVKEARIEGDTVVGVLRFSTAPDVEPVVARVKDATLQGVSVGYRVEGWREGTDAQGRRTKTPTRWTITEVSLTPNPADPSARIRNQEESDMEPETTTTTPDSAEVTRRSDIRALVRNAGLDATVADDLIDAGADLTRAKAEIWDAVQTKRRAAPIIRSQAPANDDPSVIVRRASDALVARMVGGDLPDDAKPFVHLSLKDMAAESLQRSGVSTRGMSADEVFTRAAMHTTSDFPLIVSNAVNKTAAQAYQVAQSALKVLARKKTLTNFKPASSVYLGELGKLERVAESGEITHTTITEGGESLRLNTYARAINLSRELLVNDDVHLLGDLTAAFGRAAAQTEADILVGLLNTPPKLSDGKAVFDATRGNISTPGGLSIAALSAARLAMRTRTGRDGKTFINVAPKFLVVPPELETEAEQVLAQIAAATVGDVNPWAGKLTTLVEPRLTPGTFYLFADPAVAPAIQYAYLAGAEGVQVQRREMWESLGMGYRAFLDFGAGWLDWRGAQRVAAA